MITEARDRDSGALVEVQASRGVMLAHASGGKYQEAALAGRLFHCAQINVLATSTTLDTDFEGLALTNPTGSGKIVIVHEFGYAFDTPTAANALILALAVTDDTTFAQDANVPIVCARPGFATSVCYTDEDADPITAPVIVKIISQHADAATTTFVSVPRVIDLGGSIILPEGRTVLTDTTISDTAQFSFMWEEIDA